MQIIYIDTLFLLNAMVDYLLLLAAARVAGEPLSRLRFLIGAIIGGLYAVAIFVLPFMEAPFFKISVGLMIMTIAYGKSRRLFRQGLIFLALSFSFAGGILAISIGGGQTLTLDGGVLYSPMDLKIVLLSAAACYGLLTVVFQNYGKHIGLSGELVSITLIFQEKKLTFPALIDTGNTLQDPITGTAVLVVEGETLSPFFPTPFPEKLLSQPTDFIAHYNHSGKETGIASKLRLLPYQAVGVQGLLLVLRVDQILINGQKTGNQLVALSPTPVCDGGNYKALVGAGQIN